MSASQQQIRFCTAPDGVRLAYATLGDGPPLVKAANWLSHLEFDWNSPVWRHWLTALFRHHTLIRYDERGCGLSDWDVEDFTLDAWVQDLEAVVGAQSLERFPLLGISQGGAIAIAYAAQHPDKVSHLILYGAYARGRRRRSKRAAEEAEMLLQMIRLGWGQEHPAFRQVFTSLFIPEGTPQQLNWFNDLQRISTSPENAARIVSGFYDIDVRELATQLKVPALVLHARDDLRIPFEEGRLLASLIPGARFVPLESKNHILLKNEPAWLRFVDEVYSFLGVTVPEQKTSAANSTRRDLLTTLFRQAVALPPAERGAFLDAACAHDLALRRELGALLQADDEAEANSFLGEPALWLPEPTMTPLPSGLKIGAYELLQLVGRGGMGDVYKARDERLGRFAALKFLAPHLSTQGEAKERFMQEARAASALDHTTICTIYDIGETSDRRLFMAMAFCDGETLKQRLGRGALSISDVLDMALQIADGLACAHGAGIIHRDLKPTNLMLTDQGRVKILDFGIAKLDGIDGLTRTDTRIGTAAYMSPEQARGKKVDRRTDVWGLGVVLYEMLTGQRPFRADNEAAVLYAIRHEDPEPLRTVRPDVPAPLAALVEAMLHKDPAERPATMEAIQQELRHVRARLGELS